MRAGFKATTGDVIVMLDADNSMEPGEAIVFLSALMAGADLVKGTRTIQGAGSVDLSRFRALGNGCLTRLVRWLFWCSFSDFGYGYIAFWAKHARVLAAVSRLEHQSISGH